MRKIFLLLAILSSTVQAQVYTTSYNLGDISGPINFTTVTPTACPGTLVINNIPNGQVIDSVIMSYDFFTTLAGFQSVINQRSYVACPTFSSAETQLTQPVNPPMGTIVSYNRRVTIADGQVVNGPITFIMYAGSADPLAFASCTNSQNVIMNGTWVVNVHTSNPGNQCEQPSNLLATNITHNSAQLDWNQADTSIAQWQLAFGLNGQPFASYTLLPSSSPNLNLSQLSQVSQYEVFVRAICGPNDTSIWSAPALLTTDTMPCVAPDSSWWFKRDNDIAVLYWTSIPTNTSVDIQYGEAGFTLGSGSFLSNLTNDSVRLTNLQNMAYEYYYRLNCNIVQSAWIGPLAINMSTTSVKLSDFGSFRYYPQPTNEFLHIELEYPSTFEIRDLHGRLLQYGQLETGLSTLNFTTLAQGIYWVQLRNSYGLKQIKVIYQQ